MCENAKSLTEFIYAAMFTSLLVTMYATLKFHKPSQVFYGKSTYYKTTTDYMKYSSKITENRVCKDLIY